MANPTLKSMRDQILKDRGIVSIQKRKGARRNLTPNVRPVPTNIKKTLMMKYLEDKYGKGQSIWDILTSGSLNVVVKRLGNEVERTTVSKWIKKYKLRYSESNLPDCSICSHHNGACDLGSCNVLVGLEEWDLFIVKRQKILEGLS